MKKIIYIILVTLLFFLAYSCRKDFDEDNTLLKDIEAIDPDACVLKEPFLIFQNSHCKMGVAVHTTKHVDATSDKYCKIKWKYCDQGDDSWSDYTKMYHTKFQAKGYHESASDFYIWHINIPEGSENFDPDRQVDYKVWVRYPDVQHADPLNHKDAYFAGAFYTPPHTAGQKLTFYAIGDTQEAPTDQPHEDWNCEEYMSVMNTMAEDMDKNRYERYRLLLHCGDFNFNGPWTGKDFPSHGPWNREFFARNCNARCDISYSKSLYILRRVPVMGTIGNHDWVWDHHDDRNSIRKYLATFPYPMYPGREVTLENACNQDWHLTKKPEILYYSFDYGPAHFISLSSYPTDDSDHSTCVGYGSDQISWLEHDLADTDKEWIFVFTHVPMVDGNSVKNRPMFDACRNLFLLYGVDAVLQGHYHFYERRHYDGIPYMILGGGGGGLMNWSQSHAEAYASHHFWTRFDILNNDSCYSITNRPYQGSVQVLDEFYIYNRQRKK